MAKKNEQSKVQVQDTVEPIVPTKTLEDITSTEDTDAPAPVLGGEVIGDEETQLPDVSGEVDKDENQDNDGDVVGTEEDTDAVVSKELNGEEDTDGVLTEPEENLFLSTYQEIQEVLANPDISIRDSIELISGSDLTPVKMLATRLLEYNRKMGPNAPIPTDKEGAKNNYDLYIAIKNILAADDENLYRIGMDIINLVFKEYSEEAYEERAIARFEDSWSKSKTALKSYQNLVTIISMLADRTTRKDALVGINFDKIRNDKIMDFTAKEVDRLINYYQA